MLLSVACCEEALHGGGAERFPQLSELRLVADRLYASGEQGVWELRSGSYGQPAVPFPTATALANGKDRKSVV